MWSCHEYRLRVGHLFLAPTIGPVPAYLDHAASTPMRPEAVAAMLPFLSDHPGNPSGGHAVARVAKTALEEAREEVAGILGCAPGEVVFTGGGTEADNLAVKGGARAQRATGLDGVVTSAVEHKGVLAAAMRLGTEGFRVATVGVSSGGVLDLDQLEAAVDDRTAVVSVMLVNNEVGTVQPLAQVAERVRELAPAALLHTDAVQAVPWIDVAAPVAGFDLVAVSGHKFGGPKGVGVLVVRNGVTLRPEIEGGGQERGLRAGTVNVAGAVGLATALRITHDRRKADVERVRVLRDRLQRGLADAVPSARFNGAPEHKVAGNVHVAFPGVESEALLVTLDAAGVYAAAGSSCSSGGNEPSHVLEAMGLSRTDALASVRFSLGYASTNSDVATALDFVPRAVAQLRSVAGMRERVLVAMSGGVDSSVAAALLVEAGHEVTGVTLKLWGGESDSGCCSVADVEDARPGRGAARRPALRVQFHRGLRSQRRRAVHGRVCRWPHAEPVCRVQPHDEVRPAARPRHGHGVRRGRNGPPRAHRPRRA